MFEVPGSLKCPVQTDISHLNPKMDFLFQRPRVARNKFNPEVDTVWVCNSSLGTSYLSSMMRTMSLKAEINPLLTNHCVRATSVTITWQRTKFVDVIFIETKFSVAFSICQLVWFKNRFFYLFASYNKINSLTLIAPFLYAYVTVQIYIQVIFFT